LEKCWGQGLFHNISSFVHQLEQLFRKNFFTYVMKTKFNYDLSKNHWYQLVHSDDKNEIISIAPEYHKLYIKYTTLIPRYFSLYTSDTKDSFSVLLSEMVGVLNVRSYVFDNALRGVALFTEPLIDRSFSENYKYIIGRSIAYYEKSNDLIGSTALEIIGRSILEKIYKLPMNSQILNIDTYGRNFAHPLLTRQYGIFVDNIIKISLGVPIDILKISVCRKHFEDKKIKLKREKLLENLGLLQSDVIDLISIGSSNQLIKENFIHAIELDIVLNKMKIYKETDKIQKLYLYKRNNEALDFIKTSYDERVYGSSSTICDSLLKSFNRRDFKPDFDTIPTYIYHSNELVNKVLLSSALSYSDKKTTAEQTGFVDMNNLSLRTFRIKDQIIKLSFKDFNRLLHKEFNAVFRTFSSKIRKTAILEEYRFIISYFKLTDPREFEQISHIIEGFLEIHRNTDILLLTSSSTLKDCFFCDRFLDITKGNNKLNFSQIMFEDFWKTETLFNLKSSENVEFEIKSIINRFFMDSSINPIFEILKIIKESGISMTELIHQSSDHIIFNILLNLKKSPKFSKIKFEEGDSILGFNFILLLKNEMDVDSDKLLGVTVVKKMGSIVDTFISKGRYIFSVCNNNELLNAFLKEKKLNRVIVYNYDSKKQICIEYRSELLNVLEKLGLSLIIGSDISLISASGSKTSNISFVKEKNQIKLLVKSYKNNILKALLVHPFREAKYFDLIKSSFAFLSKNSDSYLVTIDCEPEMSKDSVLRNFVVSYDISDDEVQLLVMILESSFTRIVDEKTSHMRICSLTNCSHKENENIFCLSSGVYYLNSDHYSLTSGSIDQKDFKRINSDLEISDVDFEAIYDIDLHNKIKLRKESIYNFLQNFSSINDLKKERVMSVYVYLFDKTSILSSIIVGYENIDLLTNENFRIKREKFFDTFQRKKEVVFKNIDLTPIEISFKDKTNFEFVNDCLCQWIYFNSLYKTNRERRYVALMNSLSLAVKFFPLNFTELKNLESISTKVNKFFRKVEMMEEYERVLTRVLAEQVITSSSKRHFEIKEYSEKRVNLNMLLNLTRLAESMSCIINLSEILSNWKLK
jgi:hypothetical protein